MQIDNVVFPFFPQWNKRYEAVNSDAQISHQIYLQYFKK